MTDFATFVPSGSKVLDAIQGDLDGLGGKGVILVIDPPATGAEKLGEGESRTVVLLSRDSSDSLRKVAENSKIVPCARCGGIAGDPYGYARIEKGAFTISTSGGSRERWANDYTFRYAPDAKAWLLDKVVRQVTDTATERSKVLELAPSDLGMVTFGDFDPARLEEVGALEEESEN